MGKLEGAKDFGRAAVVLGVAVPSLVARKAVDKVLRSKTFGAVNAVAERLKSAATEIGCAVDNALGRGKDAP